jgi:hypothetical protein
MNNKRNYTTNLLLYSLLCMNLFLWISSLETNNTRVEIQLSFSGIIRYSLSILSLFLLFFYNLRRNEFFKKGNFIISIFSFWSICLLILSFRYEIFFIQELFAERYFFIPYLLPLLFLFVKIEIQLFYKLIIWTKRLIFPAIIFQLLFSSFLFSLDNYFIHISTIFLFTLAPIFLLFCSSLIKSNYSFYAALLYYILNIYLSMIWGRRGWFIINLLTLILFFLTKTNYNKVNIFKSKLFLVTLVAFCTGLLFYFLNIDDFYIFQRGIDVNGLEESRGLVYLNFVNDFNKINDYLFGRGLNGLVDRAINFESSDKARFIEIGFLNYLLKGGLLYLVPMLLIFFNSIYAGIFNSNNLISKTCSFVIILQVIEMFTFGVADFSSSYCLIWIAVSANNNRLILALTNKEIEAIFSSKLLKKSL